MVNLRLRSHFGEAQWAAEQMGGISYLFFLRDLARAVEESWPEVLAVLREIHRILVNRKAMLFNITSNEPSWSRTEPHVKNLLEALPEGPVMEHGWAYTAPALLEGITIPSQVNYVGKGANLYTLGYRFHGSVLVISRYLRNTWLWDRIRVQGGAYGAFCLFDRLSGVLTFLSYRDPNLIKTLEAFDQTAQFLSETQLNNEELTKGIIGAIGDLDAHMLPDAKGYTSMLRYLTFDTEEGRQHIRDEVFRTKMEDFRAFAQILEEVKEGGIVKLLGSPSALQAATTDRPGWLKIVKMP
jgi:Zn-dependent M16 (insulinase) family peptidase